MTQKTEVYIPDGGYGWVIVTCSFLIHMFVVGTMYALSVLYVAWLDYFDSGKGLTSWIVSLAVAVMFGIGPVPGALSKRIGNRAVVIIGSLVMCFGFFISYFALNVYILMVTIGIIAGFGAGCCYLPSVSMVAMYFSSKRSIAMGISASGLGAGAFIMAPFIDWLVDYYGWRGSMFILGGIALNICVLGALMRPLEKAPRFKDCHMIRHKVVEITNDSPDISLKNFGGEEDCEQPGDMDKCEKNCEDSCREVQRNGIIRTCRRPNSHVYSILPTDTLEPALSQKAFNFPSHPVVIQQNNLLLKKTPENPFFQVSPSPDSAFKTHSLDRFKPAPRNASSLSQIFTDIYGQSELLPPKGGSLEILSWGEKPKLSPKKLYRSEMELWSQKRPVFQSHRLFMSAFQIMLSGSLSSFAYLNSTMKTTSTSSANTKNVGVSRDDQAASGSVSLLSDEGEIAPENKEVQRRSYCSSLFASFDTYLRLLRNPTFLLFGISNFLTNLSFFMPVLYMVDRALDYGIKKSEAAMLISLYGAGNIFGKVFFGWLADRELVDRLFYYILCLTICGVATSVSPLCGASPVLHSIYAFVFGCFIGAYATLVSIVTVDLMGVAVIGEAFGLLLSFMGIATAFGTPVAGWIFDWTGSYTISFILHGIFILVSALMLIPLLVVKRNQKKKVTK